MLGILILNYNNAGLTIQCIESILKVNTYPCRILVVDNASTDNSARVLAEYADRSKAFEVIVSPSNGGYAQGNNFGLAEFEKVSGIEEVVILNNDIILTEDIFPHMQDFLSSNPDAGLVGPLLFCRDGKQIDYSCARLDCTFTEVLLTYLLYFTDIFGILSHFSKRRQILRSNPELIKEKAVPVELPSGSCMMARMDVWKRINYFDPNTFLYYEENILFRKLQKIGKTNFILPTISCIHLGGQTTNKVQHSASYMKHSKASGCYYFTHYHNINSIQEIVLRIAVKVFNIMVVIVKAIKREAR